MEPLIKKLEKKEHGFTHIVEAGDQLLKGKNPPGVGDAIDLLKEESYQARMLATYILGQLSVTHKTALQLLRTRVGKDEHWRVQEMLARAFDHYCKTTGYEKSLPLIGQWLKDKNPNVKRAVVEGLRIWTSRPYFKEHPSIAIELISRHRADESEYLRKSVGNALRDIRKKHEDLVDADLREWNLDDAKTAFTRKLIG